MTCKLGDAMCIEWATLWPSGGYQNAGVCPGRQRNWAKRRLLPARVAGHRANFCSRRVGTRSHRYDKKAWDCVRCAARCGAAKSRFHARRIRLAPPDRHRERRQSRRIPTAPLHTSEFACHLSVNGCVSRRCGGCKLLETLQGSGQPSRPTFTERVTHRSYLSSAVASRCGGARV